MDIKFNRGPEIWYKNYKQEKDYTHINKEISDEDKRKTKRRRDLEFSRDLNNLTKEIWE